MTRWDSARQLLGLGKRRGTAPPAALAPRLAGRADAAPRPAAPARRARSVCIASGKGGTGKSSVSASLAALFARRGRTLLLDADLGCANAHILQGARPERSFADVLRGDVGMPDIVTRCDNGVDLLAGGSGYASLAGLRTFELEIIGRGLGRLEPDYDHLVVDSAAGLSRQTVAFAAACDLTVLVTTPDLTAMTDAYAFLKVFARQCAAQGIERPMPLLVVNRAASEEEAAGTAKRLQEVVGKFLGTSVEYLAALPEDRAAYRCSQRRTTVVEGEPDSDLARALESVGHSVLARLARMDGA
ncbi:MAG: P-loop NTPase, partial [Planctomycetota bacterium]